MTINFLIKSADRSHTEASISSNSVVVAKLTREERGKARLVSLQGETWTLSQTVDGEIRPFSMLVERETGNNVVVLKIRDHLFAYNGKMYMLSNVPQGMSQHLALIGSKFISRLDGFPYEDPSSVDLETRNRLRRHRGVPVGQMSGIGASGQIVKIEKELEGVGLPLAASAFLLYTTAIGIVHLRAKQL